MEMQFNEIARETILEVAKETHFQTGFNFLKSHNGFRRETVHTFIAPTHSGKSTFFRSILKDLLGKNKTIKIAIYLSEDDRNSFLVDMAKSTIADDDLNNRIKVFYEMEMNEFQNDENKFFKNINDLCKDFQPDVFILDNLTTAAAYIDRKTDIQAKICMRLKNFSKHYNCATIVFAHTNAQLKAGQIIDVNDIRGSKHLANISPVIYAIQQVSFYNPANKRDEKVNILFIKKHRGMDVKNSIFAFKYDVNSSTYVYDEAIQFEQFKALFDKRHKL